MSKLCQGGVHGGMAEGCRWGLGKWAGLNWYFTQLEDQCLCISVDSKALNPTRLNQIKAMQRGYLSKPCRESVSKHRQHAKFFFHFYSHIIHHYSFSKKGATSRLQDIKSSHGHELPPDMIEKNKKSRFWGGGGHEWHLRRVDHWVKFGLSLFVPAFTLWEWTNKPTLHHLGQLHNSVELEGGSMFVVVATKDMRFIHKDTGQSWTLFEMGFASLNPLWQQSAWPS